MAKGGASLAAGLSHSLSLPVSTELTVPAVSAAFTGFADMPPVFATAFMVGFVEWTCIEALAPHLAPGQATVGTLVDLTHIAATPVGMTVTAKVDLVAVEGRRLRFKVECWDEREAIGSGFHERAIVDRGKFLERVARKASDDV
jgi:fluoroacetyl-CoA thioesterase